MYWCLFVDNLRLHRLISLTRELASSRRSVYPIFELGNALHIIPHPDYTSVRFPRPLTLKLINSSTIPTNPHPAPIQPNCVTCIYESTTPPSTAPQAMPR